MDVPAAIPQPVVLYDGTCGLCHRSVRWLMKRDRRRLWYAPLQGETFARAVEPAVELHARRRGLEREFPRDLAAVGSH